MIELIVQTLLGLQCDFYIPSIIVCIHNFTIVAFVFQEILHIHFLTFSFTSVFSISDNLHVGKERSRSRD